MLDCTFSPFTRASQVVLVAKNLPANAGDVRDKSLVPGSGRSPGEGHGNPLQYSCLDNPMDRGAWQATVLRVTKSQTRLKGLNTNTHLPKSCTYCPFSLALWSSFSKLSEVQSLRLQFSFFPK